MFLLCTFSAAKWLHGVRHINIHIYPYQAEACCSCCSCSSGFIYLGLFCESIEQLSTDPCHLEGGDNWRLYQMRQGQNLEGGRNSPDSWLTNSNSDEKLLSTTCPFPQWGLIESAEGVCTIDWKRVALTEGVSLLTRIAEQSWTETERGGSQKWTLLIQYHSIIFHHLFLFLLENLHVKIYSLSKVIDANDHSDFFQSRSCGLIK